MFIKLLKPGEVADILQVSRSFCYQLLQRGQIRSVRIGRAVRVREGDLLDFIQENIYSDSKPVMQGSNSNDTSVTYTGRSTDE